MRDYHLVNTQLRDLVKGIFSDRETPWAPHMGIRLTLGRAPLQLEAARLTRPNDFPLATEKRELGCWKRS